MTILRTALLGAAAALIAAPAFAFDVASCSGAYSDADLTPELPREKLEARCGCVADAAAGNDALLAKFDGVLAAPVAERVPMMEADAEMGPILKTCEAAHP